MPKLDTIISAVQTDFPETVRPDAILVAKTHRKPTFNAVTDAVHVKASGVTITRSTFMEKAMAGPRFSDVEAILYTTEESAEPQDLVWDGTSLHRIQTVEQVDQSYYKWLVRRV